MKTITKLLVFTCLVLLMVGIVSATEITSNTTSTTEHPCEIADNTQTASHQASLNEQGVNKIEKDEKTDIPEDIKTKNEINKTYNVTIKGRITKEEVELLKNGVEIDNGYITKPAEVKILKIDEEKNISRIQIIIHEGKNRQIRKMCASIRKKVLALHRSKIGNIDVKNLKIGEWRYLTNSELKVLQIKK